MLSSIKHKLLAAVLLAVVLPFAAFSWFLERALVDDLAWQFVLESLQGMARDLAEQVDQRVLELTVDLDLWAREPLASWALDEADGADDGDPWGPAEILAAARGESVAGAPLRRASTTSLDRYVATKQRHQLLVLIGRTGRAVTVNSQGRDGEPLDAALLERVFAHDFAAEPWFASVLAGDHARIDHHVAPLLHPDGVAGRPPSADLYSIALAAPVPQHLGDGEVGGAMFALVSWRTFQDLIDTPIVKDVFRGLAAAGDEPSPYAWLWSSDGERILAHEDPRLYLARLRDPPIALPRMVEDVNRQSSDGSPVRGGLYRSYEFRGKAKNAAFHRSAPVELGGFDWVVGVGIDDDDVEAATVGLSWLLMRGTLVVLAIVVLWVTLVARRTTQPILALRDHTRRVAAGDLDARIDIDRRDEIGALADAFNAMTRDLAENRRQLVRAEKDAAWREMARQIAHDIKGPLTPMRLSLDLLERSLAEQGPKRDEVVRRTLEMMRRQVEALRDIASDFYHFTGGARSRPERVAMAALVSDVLELHRAWAQELGVAVSIAGSSGDVYADPGKLRRVLANLVTNALQAMPEGGELLATVVQGEGRVELVLDDTGVGLSEEVRARLFEPYFTTRSEGTGLGLAIAQRTLEDMGGGIELVPRPDGGRGTRVRLWLPAAGPSGAL